MIDEKWLDELDKETAPFGNPNMSEEEWEQFEELIRLARLGRWAEKHGIPVLRTVSDRDWYFTGSNGWNDCSDLFKEALAALPKE